MRCVLNKIPLAFAILAVIAAAQDNPAPEFNTEDLGYRLRTWQWKQLDPNHVAVLGTAMIGAGKDGLRFLVVNTNHNERPLELDKFSEGELALSPRLEVINAQSAYLHFYGNYGFYRGSIKYLFDLGSGKLPVKVRYGFLALTSVSRVGGKLVYSASFPQAGEVEPGWPTQHLRITVEPNTGLPAYDVAGAGEPMHSTPVEPATLRGPGGEVVTVQNTTPPGQPHRPSTIFVDQKAFPAPIPTIDFYRQKLPQKQPPLEMESDIGPFVQRGDTIWFATTFYDGEGMSGIGAIGAFNISTHQYERRYFPEIAPWSGTAMMLDGDEVWVGLERHPEGADIGGGLLRYNLATEKAEMFSLPDVIFTIDRVGDALYCGTSRGLYLKRGRAITQLRFEPDGAGRIVMVAHGISRPVVAQPSAR